MDRKNEELTRGGARGDGSTLVMEDWPVETKDGLMKNTA